METINIWLIIGISLFCCFVGALYWLTKPDKCPFCGETMKYFTQNIKGKERYFMRCPKCEHIEEITDGKTQQEEDSRP